MPTWHGPLEAEVKLFVCPSYVKGVSVLKNPFAPISAPGSEAKCASFVVFWPCLWPHLDRRPGQQRLFQHAGEFCEVRRHGVLRNSSTLLTGAPTTSNGPSLANNVIA